MQNPNVTYLPTQAIQSAVAQFPTPFFVYEEERIRANCHRIQQAFKPLFPNFQPLFAVKANPNPHVVRIIQSEGFGLDCSSLAEAWLAKELNVGGMHTGNYVTPEELEYVLKQTKLMLNLDDASMLSTVQHLGVPKLISFRINPGIGGSVDIGSNVLAGPDAKYGIPAEQTVAAYRAAQAIGITEFGIHMMTGSNVLDAEYFGTITRRLLEIVGEIKRATGITIKVMNIGGGFGVPYKPEESSLNLTDVANHIRAAFDELCPKLGIQEPQLMIEPGRYLTADAGWLVGKVVVIKDSYKKYVGIDASSNDMPRPSIYDAYHHATILNNSTETELVSIVGSICENNDQLAKDRLLPKANIGDVVVIHNSGGHAYAMGHNYNGKPRHAEYLLKPNQTLQLIRRAETIEDLYRTIV